MGDRKCIVRYRGIKMDMGGIQRCMGNAVGTYRELHTVVHWGLGLLVDFLLKTASVTVLVDTWHIDSPRWIKL